MPNLKDLKNPDRQRHLDAQDNQGHADGWRRRNCAALKKLLLRAGLTRNGSTR